jgi:glycogen(starch) synthase
MKEGTGAMTRSDSPRRVMMTANPVGGVWTYTLELAAALGRRGIEVDIATMGGRLDEHQRAEVDRLGLSVHESEFRLEWMQDPWDDVDRAGDWLLGLAEELDPDIVHLNGLCHGALPWNKPVVLVAHSCLCSWWRAVHGDDPPAEWIEYRRRALAGLRAADRVVAVSSSLLRELDEAYEPLPHGVAILNGRDPSAVRPGLKQPFILSTGRLWDQAKNLVALDRAAPEVPWPIHVAGEARHPDGREVRPRHLEVLGRLPWVELTEWMEHAAIYAGPARYEPFGLGALEAGLAGCALVLGDIPSLREIWGDAAIFVPPEDAEGLGTALRTLAADVNLRGERARAARLRALTLDAVRMTDAYEALYRELAVDSADTGAFRASGRSRSATRRMNAAR